MHYEFRPIDTWPGDLTPAGARKYSPFKADYGDTLDLLDRELWHLNARDVVFEVALLPADIRLDGRPRANARPAAHPGVVVSFGSIHGPLRYACDAFRNWQANLRAIALGLEALRKVERYGITKRGEQYTGWSALPPGSIAAGPSAMTLDEAIAFLHEHTGPDAGWWDHDDPDAVDRAYLVAAKKLHPDAGGDAELFKRLQQAKAVLDA